MKLVTRYTTDQGHGWYVGSRAEIVLAPGESAVWPGMFAAFCRLRGCGAQDFAFRSPQDELEFLQNVRRPRSWRTGTPSQGRNGRDAGIVRRDV